MVNMATSKKGGKKKTAGRKATPAESFTQFQIDVKLKEIEELMEEIKELEAKRQNLIALQKQLRQEQQGPLRVLHKEGKEQEKNVKENEVSNKEKVEQAVQKNIELSHIQEEELTELQRPLTNAQDQFVELQMQQQAWHLYKKSESGEQQRQMQKLQSEFDSIQKNFEAMSEYVESSLKANLIKVEQNTLGLVEEQNAQASEKAEQEVEQQEHNILDTKKNDWLKKEVKNYHEEISHLDADVRKLEEENLEHVKQLKRFLTQDEDLEQKLSLPERAAATGRTQHQQSEELEEDEMLYGSQSDLEEPLYLDPSEQSMLRVVGQAIPLHPYPFDPEDVDMLARLGMLQPQEGAVTTAIIRNKFQ